MYRKAQVFFPAESLYAYMYLLIGEISLGFGEGEGEGEGKDVLIGESLYS